MVSTSLWFVLLSGNNFADKQECNTFVPTTMQAFRTDTCFAEQYGRGFKVTCDGNMVTITTYSSSTCAIMYGSEVFSAGCDSSSSTKVYYKMLCQDTSKVTTPPIDYLDYVYYKYYHKSVNSCESPIAYHAYRNEVCIDSNGISSIRFDFPQLQHYPDTPTCGGGGSYSENVPDRECKAFDGNTVPYRSPIYTHLHLGSGEYNEYTFYSGASKTVSDGSGDKDVITFGEMLNEYKYILIPVAIAVGAALVAIIYCCGSHRLYRVKVVRTVPNPKYHGLISEQPSAPPEAQLVLSEDEPGLSSVPVVELVQVVSTMEPGQTARVAPAEVEEAAVAEPPTMQIVQYVTICQYLVGAHPRSHQDIGCTYKLERSPKVTIRSPPRRLSRVRPTRRRYSALTNSYYNSNGRNDNHHNSGGGSSDGWGWSNTDSGGGGGGGGGGWSSTNYGGSGGGWSSNDYGGGGGGWSSCDSGGGGGGWSSNDTGGGGGGFSSDFGGGGGGGGGFSSGGDGGW